jgi:hypothetical protein
MKKILIDGGEFGFEHFVQDGNNFCVTFHVLPLFLLCPWRKNLKDKNQRERSRAISRFYGNSLRPRIVLEPFYYLAQTGEKPAG